jgi:hypothetical protein
MHRTIAITAFVLASVFAWTWAAPARSPVALLPELIGERAMPGAFAKGELDHELAPETVARFEKAGIAIDSDDIDRTLTIAVRTDPDGTCTALVALLLKRWGQGSRTPSLMWFDRVRGVRAQYQPPQWAGLRGELVACALVFRHYTSFDAFIGAKPTPGIGFPYWLVGQPQDKVTAEFRRFWNDGRRSWLMPALEDSIGETNVIADFRAGVAIRIVAELPDMAILPRLRAHLEKLYGKPEQAQTEPLLRWHVTPPLAIDTRGNLLRVVAGEPLPSGA